VKIDGNDVGIGGIYGFGTKFVKGITGSSKAGKAS